MQKPKDPNQVSWDGPDDPENPQNWSQGYKWWLTVATMIMCINVTFASSAPTSAVLLLKQQFHTSREVADLITSVFLLGYCIGPLFWGPGSELMGRRPVFLIAMFSYTVLILGQSLAPNVETLLVTRFLSGFFACAPVNNSGGVIADIWGAETRGLAVSLIAASVFLGPVLGPIISGFIVDSHLSWRWVFWVMMIFAGVCSLITTPFFPETYGPILLHRKAERLRREEPEKHTKLFSEHEKQDWTFGGVIRRTILRPFIMLMLEPILSLITIYLSMVYGVLYALFSAFPIIFVGVRGFSISQNGLIFIGVGIGTIVGSLINVWTSRGYNELIKKWKGFPPPEERLYSAMIGAPALVVGAFWLGWTGHYASVPWYVPAISTILIGAGINLVFMSFLTYLVDTYLIFSASAMAANTVIRSAVAAGFPLFTIHMFTRLGINWACTLIALLALFFVPAPFLFYKYGPLIRTKSKFAPCVDLAIAAKMKEAAEAAKKQGGLNV
ncbi:MFS general substrate transporter [Coprinopsis marcescibilis]|uniref:MFS general substrate transporter n=1 Tax=Coprinopsis marcescibilis TaxID=230819 RepID=A0A5C3KSB4_COPMA|nr:MFS general substrate transporter [Coprinopsis marcescibilis]